MPLSGTPPMDLEPRRIARTAILREAWLTTAARPARVLLTAAATGLGIGILVLVLGLTTTTEQQVAADFDALRATQVLVTQPAWEETSAAPELDRLQDLNGVRAVGVVRTGPSTAVRKLDAGQGPAAQADLVYATSGALAALEVNIAVGAPYNSLHDERGSRVALVGERVARDLSGLIVDGRSSVLIDELRYTVAGIIQDTPRRATLIHSVVIPASQQAVPGQPEVVVLTAPGAAQTIARQAPLALVPTDPEEWAASAPPDPETLRTQIEEGVRGSLLAVAGAVLVVAALSIANSMLVSVLERRREIGIRRALGATGAHIRLQVLSEASLVGAIGGVAGVGLALVALVAVCTVQQWRPVLDPAVPLAAPVLGVVIGLLSGLLPARRASRIAPVEAMRAG